MLVWLKQKELPNPTVYVLNFSCFLFAGRATSISSYLFMSFYGAKSMLSTSRASTYLVLIVFFDFVCFAEVKFLFLHFCGKTLKGPNFSRFLRAIWLLVWMFFYVFYILWVRKVQEISFHLNFLLLCIVSHWGCSIVIVKW